MDVLLVLAVDVSRSIDEDEAWLRTQGYREAMTDPRVLAAIRNGMLGAIAVAYVEWAGIEYQRLVIPWTRIATAEDALRWSETLAEAPRVSLSWTSISGAIRFSREVLAQAPMEGLRAGDRHLGRWGEQFRPAGRSSNATSGGRGHHHQRPADHQRPLESSAAARIPLDQYFRDDAVIGGPVPS